MEQVVGGNTPLSAFFFRCARSPACGETREQRFVFTFTLGCWLVTPRALRKTLPPGGDPFSSVANSSSSFPPDAAPHPPPFSGVPAPPGVVENNECPRVLNEDVRHPSPPQFRLGLCRSFPFPLGPFFAAISRFTSTPRIPPRDFPFLYRDFL